MPSSTSPPDCCPRCGGSFVCRANAIGTCDCARVALTPEQRATIRAYTEQALGGYACLCNRCLEELKTIEPTLL